MFMSLKRVLIFASTLLALVGCQKVPSPTAPTQSNNGAPTSHAVATKSSSAISVNPATLQSCDGAVATVQWDASKADVTTDSIEIWVGSSNTDTKLFSAGGSAGETKTGPWTHPGTHFLLKNKQDGKLLGEAVVGGSSCP
jgi:ABC-type transport system substrate-binding protein